MRLAWGMASIGAWTALSVAACASEAADPAPTPSADAAPDATSSSSSSGSGNLASDASTDAMQDADVTPQPATELVHFLGRFDTRDAAGPRFQWSGSALVATFRGTGIAVRLDGSTQMHVILDGQEQPRLYASEGAASLPLARGLADGEHTIELHKRDEAMFGPVQFLGFEVEGGELLPSVFPRAHRIEFIGDSITCGYGNEDTSNGCPFSANTENHYLTYAALTARALDAAHTAIAWSGRGMYRNYPDASRFEPTLPQLFDRILPRDETSTWDFARFTPEAVVVNLGTNDYAINDDPGQAYVDTYVAFLERLRSLYPEAHVFAVMQQFPAGAQARVQAAVEARASAGDARVHYFGFGPTFAEDGLGCDGHPSVAGHTRMAAELTPVIRATMGW